MGKASVNTEAFLLMAQPTLDFAVLTKHYTGQTLLIYWVSLFFPRRQARKKTGYICFINIIHFPITSRQLFFFYKRKI